MGEQFVSSFRGTKVEKRCIFPGLKYLAAKEGQDFRLQKPISAQSPTFAQNTVAMSAILLSSDKPEDIRLLVELAERLGVHFWSIPKRAQQLQVLRKSAGNATLEATPEDVPDYLVAQLLEEIRLERLALNQQSESVKTLLLSKPLRETFDVEAIKREQHWQGQHDKLAIMQLIEEMDIEEPIETLLAQLTK